MKSEIGYSPAATILVVAPLYDIAVRWAHTQGLMTSEITFVNPSNFEQKLCGLRGAPHVILNWSHHLFDGGKREAIRLFLASIESEPYDGEDPNEPGSAAAVRD